MAQTPISVSSNITGGVASTVYTVPASTTAIVKTALGKNVTGGTSLFTLQKVVSGNYYPLTIQQNPVVTPATGGTANQSVNLLSGPVTLAAGESISVYDSASPYYKFPANGTFSTVNSASYQFRNFWYGNGVYIAIGQDITNGTSILARSTDAITWTEIATGNKLVGSSNPYYIKNIGSTWVASVANNRTIMYSTDNGLTWTTFTFSAGAIVTGFDANSSTFVMGTGLGLYTSTNGSSWTLNSSYTSYINQTINNNAYVPQGIFWNGTYWFISNSYGCSFTTDLTNFTPIFGPSGGRRTMTYQFFGCNYSPAYSKYYSAAYYPVNNSSSRTDVIWSSTNGYVWDQTLPGTTALSAGSGTNGLTVACAGSNTVLLAKGAGGSSYLKSTNGTTWSAASDVRGYTGQIYGLANGTFLVTAAQNGAQSFYISTDPSTLTGTNFSSATANPYPQGAASDGTGWVYVYVDGNTSNNALCAYGPNSTTMTANGVNIDAGIAFPVMSGVVWWAAIGKYVAWNNNGTYFWTSTTGASWTRSSFTASANGSNASVVVCGDYLYVVSPGNAGGLLSYWTSTTWDTQSATTMANNGFYNTSAAYPTQYAVNKYSYPASPGALASNGTEIVFSANQDLGGGYTGVIRPTFYSGFITPSWGLMYVERVNGYDIFYAGYTPNQNANGYGYGYSTNMVTSLTNRLVSTEQTMGTTGYTNLGNWIVYNQFNFYGGNYYFSPNVGNTASITVNSDISRLTSTYNYNVSTTSIGGVPTVDNAVANMSNRITNDGTYFILYGYNLNVYKGTQPQNSRATSVISLGLIEIT
jgi:hypothetical protein